MIPTVKAEAQFAGAWVDVSDRLEAGSGFEVSITRGRASEVDTVQPGSAAFTLDNFDGAFTPGNPASPYYPNVTSFVPVRLSVARPVLDGGDAWATHSSSVSGGSATATPAESVDGGVAADEDAYRTRFTGYASAWPVVWRSGTGLESDVTVAAVDLLSVAGLRTLSYYARNKIMEYAPVAYYPLTEASDSTRADDVSGNHQSRLTKTQVGTLGEFAFGDTDSTPTPLEGQGMVKLTPSGTDGFYLLSDSALSTFGTSFTMVSLSKPTASGYIWQINQGSYILGLYWDSATSFYRVRQYDGAWSTLVSSSAAKTGMYCEVVTVTATTVTLRSDGTRTATARAAATFTTPTLKVGYCIDSTGGFADLGAATIGQVAVIGSALTMTATTGQADVLAGHLTQAAVGFTQYADDLLEFALGWAGFAGQTVTYLGTRTELGFVPTDGKTVASLADDLARGTAGRCVVSTDGALIWVGPDYSPTIVELESGDVESSITWATDLSTYVTDATTTLPSGGSYTYASITAGLIRASRELIGVQPTDADCQEFVQFIVSGSSLDPRIPNCVFDLLTLPASTVEELLALDIGSVFSLSGLPTQIPDDRVLVVEGVTERCGTFAWELEFNTSPSSRIIPPVGWGFFTLDDAVFGLLDTATNVLASI